MQTKVIGAAAKYGSKFCAESHITSTMIPDFDAPFRTFVARHIDSVEQIDVLLLLSGSPQKVWSIDELAATLRSNRRSVSRRLAALERSKLVAREDDGYCYCARGSLDAMVQRLATEYAVRRTSIIQLVFSRPDTAELFADAFRIWDDDHDHS